MKASALAPRCDYCLKHYNVLWHIGAHKGKVHRCHPPGWFRRLFGEYKYGDHFECPGCGTVYVLRRSALNGNWFWNRYPERGFED